MVTWFRVTYWGCAINTVIRECSRRVERTQERLEMEGIVGNGGGYGKWKNHENSWYFSMKRRRALFYNIAFIICYHKASAMIGMPATDWGSSSHCVNRLDVFTTLFWFRLWLKYFHVGVLREVAEPWKQPVFQYEAQTRPVLQHCVYYLLPQSLCYDRDASYRLRLIGYCVNR